MECVMRDILRDVDYFRHDIIMITENFAAAKDELLVSQEHINHSQNVQHHNKSNVWCHHEHVGKCVLLP